jgi:hypothetical protein
MIIERPSVSLSMRSCGARTRSIFWWMFIHFPWAILHCVTILQNMSIDAHPTQFIANLCTWAGSAAFCLVAINKSAFDDTKSCPALNILSSNQSADTSSFSISFWNASSSRSGRISPELNPTK